MGQESVRCHQLSGSSSFTPCKSCITWKDQRGEQVSAGTNLGQSVTSFMASAGETVNSHSNVRQISKQNNNININRVTSHTFHPPAPQVLDIPADELN